MTASCEEISFLEAQKCLMEKTGQLVMLTPKLIQGPDKLVSLAALSIIYIKGLDGRLYRCYYQPWPGCVNSTSTMYINPPDSRAYTWYRINLEYLILNMGFYPLEKPNPKLVILTDLMLGPLGLDYSTLVEYVENSNLPTSAFKDPTNAFTVWGPFFNRKRVRIKSNV